MISLTNYDFQGSLVVSSLFHLPRSINSWWARHLWRLEDQHLHRHHGWDPLHGASLGRWIVLFDGGWNMGEPIKYRDLETQHGDLPIQNRNWHDLTDETWWFTYRNWVYHWSFDSNWIDPSLTGDLPVRWWSESNHVSLRQWVKVVGDPGKIVTG